MCDYDSSRQAGALVGISPARFSAAKDVLREWLGVGKDTLSVTDLSLDRAVQEVIHALLPGETWKPS
jgi:hypothetical protein